jgi:hypothetical protein
MSGSFQSKKKETSTQREQESEATNTSQVIIFFGLNQAIFSAYFSRYVSVLSEKALDGCLFFGWRRLCVVRLIFVRFVWFLRKQLKNEVWWWHGFFLACECMLACVFMYAWNFIFMPAYMLNNDYMNRMYTAWIPHACLHAKYSKINGFFHLPPHFLP